jgi:glycine oxidase
VRPDVLVAGAGVVGCAVARELAQAGLAVTVLERGEPGREASHAAAGMLSPLAEGGGTGPFQELLDLANTRFPALADRLLAETGIDIGFRDRGTLAVALGDRDVEVLDERASRMLDAGLEVDRLSASETLALEPALCSSVRGSLRLPLDRQVENRALTRALWAAAVGAGAEFRTGVDVVGIRCERGRVTGVDAAGGERFSAGRVVLAAGSWTGGLGGLPGRVPVEPVHGQIVAVSSLPPLLEHVVHAPGCYLVPRADGRLLIGATTERTGFVKAVTARGVHSLLAAGIDTVPQIADLPLIDAWAGLRPGTPDGMPILGADPALENLFYATGHYRNGILLAPLTAEIIRHLLVGGPAPVDLSPFRVDRFRP